MLFVREMLLHTASSPRQDQYWRRNTPTLDSLPHGDMFEISNLLALLVGI